MPRSSSIFFASILVIALQVQVHGLTNEELSSMEDLRTAFPYLTMHSSNPWVGPASGCCSWHGVTCPGLHVTGIALTLLPLAGTIPSTISGLNFLTSLEIQSSQINGTIPPEIGSLVALERLALENNRLTSTIPPELGNLTNLQSLTLYLNAELEGTIPHQFSNLKQLTLLWIYNCDLSGTIPEVLGEMTALTNLQLQSNSLTGPIPESLGNTPLTTMRLNDNQLTGNLPSWLANRTMSWLTLNNNALDLCSEMPYLSSVGLCTIGPQILQSCSSTFNCSQNLGVCVTGGSITNQETCSRTACRSPQPSPSFYCDNGIWISTSDLFTTSVTVDSGWVISGDFGVSGSLTFTGLNSSISARGCISINGSIEVILDAETLDFESNRMRTLLSQNASRNCTSLGSLFITAKTDSNTCKKIQTRTEVSENNGVSSLNAIFTVDSSNCKKNTWWIILLGVLGGVLVIAVALVLAFTLIESLRVKVRPYSKPRRQGVNIDSDSKEPTSKSCCAAECTCQNKTV